MKMIEPCVIHYIPNITKMNLKRNSNLTIEENDDYWFDVFNCSLNERLYIRKHFSKIYNRISIE